MDVLELMGLVGFVGLVGLEGLVGPLGLAGLSLGSGGPDELALLGVSACYGVPILAPSGYYMAIPC